MQRVLIVEDDKNIRKGLEEIVKSVDSNIIIDSTGEAKEAYKYASENKIDLFLFDIQLEDYSGVELAKEIRELDGYEFTFMIFITAVPTREIECFKNIHCYDYILKPFNNEDLKEMLEKILFKGVKEAQVSTLSLKQRNFTHRIRQDEILYIEYHRRKLHVQTDKDRFSATSYTLDKIIEELDNSFVRCHKGFIVNKNFVIGYDKKEKALLLRGTDETVPVGGQYKDTVVEGL